MLKKAKIVMLLIVTIMTICQVKIKANTVEYRGELGGLIATPDDFFLELGELLPGDTKEDMAYIKNSTDDEIEVFFKTEPLDKTEYYDDIDYSLLEKIQLTISIRKNASSKEELLYEGNLGAELMKEYISLGEYKKGYDGEFIFRIQVPTELRNDYTLSTTKVKWVFAVEKKEKEQGNIGDEISSNDPSSSDDVDGTNGGVIQGLVQGVKTGDTIYYATGVLILATLVIVMIIVMVRRKKDEE